MLRVAIITGGAVGVWDERDLAVELVAAAGHRAVYVAANDSGVEHPHPLHHWASLHANQFVTAPHRWEARRQERGLRRTYRRWGIKLDRYVDAAAKRWTGGSSGLLALDVALNHACCSGAILCGVPMDERLNVFKRKAWSAHQRYRHGWSKRLPEIRDRARSLSGWTAQLLGVPSVEWLRGLEARQDCT